MKGKKERKISTKMTITYSVIFAITLIFISGTSITAVFLNIYYNTKKQITSYKSVLYHMANEKESSESLKKQIRSFGLDPEKIKFKDKILILREVFAPFFRNSYNIYSKVKINEDVISENISETGHDFSDVTIVEKMVKVKRNKGKDYYIIYNTKFEVDDVGVIEITFAKDIKFYMHGMRFLIDFFLIVDIIIILISVIVIRKLSIKTLKPINHIIDIANEITINDLSRRVEVSNANDELTKLGNTINNTISRLEKSIKLQNKFVSDASHELRTPLSVMHGYLDLLDGWGKDDPKVLDESIGVLKEEVFNMKNLIEKLLFLARGENGTITVTKEKLCLGDIINKLIKDTMVIDKERKIFVDRFEDFKINGDNKLLLQAFRAIIENSRKYTNEENGEITIELYKQNEYAVVSIADNGIGISDENKEKVFERFYRVDKSRTKATGGNGLGLSIVKKIVDMHQGIIEIESELNIGTKVIIKLKYI